MTDMDAEKLRSYIGLKRCIIALQAEIEEQCNLLSSIRFQNYDTMRMVEARREKLTKLLNEDVAVIKEIENWLDGLHDPYAESIIRYHYFLGLSWRTTALKVGGYVCGDTLRVYIRRLLAKEEQEKSDDAVVQ